MPRRRAKRQPPPSPRPWPCVLLCIDTARGSGWSLWLRGVYQDSGELDALTGDLEAVVARALELATRHRLPAALVYELPFQGTRQGGHAGTWKRAWVQAGGVQRRMLGVYPATWRARVLGRGLHAVVREVVRPHEQALARAYAGRPCGGDESPAVCIGLWAARAGQVGAKLPVGKK